MDMSSQDIQEEIGALRKAVKENEWHLLRLSQTIHGDNDLGFTKGLLVRLNDLSERVENYQMDTQEKIGILTENIQKIVDDREAARISRESAEAERNKWLKIAGVLIGGGQFINIIYDVVQSYLTVP